MMLLGWPLVGVAVLTLTLAIRVRSRWLAAAGCVLLAPMLLYLAATPRFQWVASLSLGLLVLLAWRLDRLRPVSIALLLLPAATLLVWLAVIVTVR